MILTAPAVFGIVLLPQRYLWLMWERQDVRETKRGREETQCVGDLRQVCSPLKCRAADDGHNALGHSDDATFSDSSEKKQKAQSQIASDKEGMSSRAIHRHSACGEVLKKKVWPKAEAFVFIQKSQAAVLWIHHWKNLPGFWLLPCNYNQQMVIISQAGASGQLPAKHK